MYSKFPSEPVSAEQMTFSDIFDRFRYKPEREPVRTYDSYYDRGYERTRTYDSDYDSNCDRERTQEYEPETPSRKPPKRSRSADFDMEL